MPAFDPLERDRVVEVAGVDRIDRDDRPPGQVPPVGGHGLVEPLGLAAGILERRLGKLAGQGELVDDRLRVDPDVAGPPEDADHDPLAVAQVGGKPHEFHHHLVALVHPLRTRIPDGNRARDGRAVDLDPSAAAGLEVRAHESRRASCHDLHDLSGRTRATGLAPRRESHAHGVAADRVERRRGSDVDVARPIAGKGALGMDETVPAGSPSEHAHDPRGATPGRGRLRAFACHGARPRKNLRPRPA